MLTSYFLLQLLSEAKSKRPFSHARWMNELKQQTKLKRNFLITFSDDFHDKESNKRDKNFTNFLQFSQDPAEEVGHFVRTSMRTIREFVSKKSRKSFFRIQWIDFSSATRIHFFSKRLFSASVWFAQLLSGERRREDACVPTERVVYVSRPEYDAQTDVSILI